MCSRFRPVGEPIDIYVPPEARWATIRQSPESCQSIERALHTIRMKGGHPLNELEILRPLLGLAKNSRLCRQMVETVSAIDLSGLKNHDMAY